MRNFEDNDEEVPRIAPKQKELTFQRPTAPVVPEVSIVMNEKPSNFHGETVSTSFLTEAPLNVKSYRKTAKSNLKYLQKFRLEKTTTTPKVLQISHPEVKPQSPNLQKIPYPPNPIPSEAIILNEKKSSDDITEQFKLHGNQIAELKELIEKLSKELMEFKQFETGEHEKTRIMLTKPKIYYESIGIQCKLDQENLNETDKRSDPKLEMNQKTTGSIPKIKTVKETCDAKSTEIALKLNLSKLEIDVDKYEIWPGLPRPRLNEAAEIMALICKYVPRERLREWGFTDEAPGRRDVSIATRRYMEKYGLIGSIQEERDEAATGCTQESTSKILDSKAIKNQPKFL